MSDEMQEIPAGPYECVGGPLDGQWYDLQPGHTSLTISQCAMNPRLSFNGPMPMPEIWQTVYRLERRGPQWVLA